MFDFKQAIAQDKAFADSVWEKLDKKLQVMAVRSREKLPYTTENGEHINSYLRGICSWTNGFWPGMMWLLYYGTKNETYRTTAERSEELLDEGLKEYEGLHHDVGFMWQLSAVADYKITGNKASRIRALHAANLLMARYNIRGGFIRAWNDWDEKCEQRGWTIIDCMMNLSLLYWASEEINDPRYKYVAMAHADKAMEHHIRPDGSVRHIVSFNPENGEFIEALGGQGYDENSSWSRGQAWALYGYAISYMKTGKTAYLDTAKRVAHYFISCVSDDYMPRSDFRAPKEPVIYDSSAGAIAACGLLELARLVPANEGAFYYDAAVKLLKVIDENWCDYTLEEDSILQMCTSSWTKEGLAHRWAHKPLIFGEYYFVEAIYKLKGFDLLFE